MIQPTVSDYNHNFWLVSAWDGRLQCLVSNQTGSITLTTSSDYSYSPEAIEVWISILTTAKRLAETVDFHTDIPVLTRPLYKTDSSH